MYENLFELFDHLSCTGMRKLIKPFHDLQLLFFQFNNDFNFKNRSKETKVEKLKSICAARKYSMNSPPLNYLKFAS